MYWPDINFPPINLWSLPVQNLKQDKRAASLKLRVPKKACKEYRNFFVSKALDDADHVKNDRMDLCRQIRNRNMK